jgi:hypothetical protein
MQKAVKRPGALSKRLGIPEDEDIPMTTISKELAKLKKKRDSGKKLSKDEQLFEDQLNFAKNVKKKAASTKQVQIQMPVKIVFIELEPWVRGFIRIPELGIEKTFSIPLEPGEGPEDIKRINVSGKDYTSGPLFKFFKQRIRSLLRFAR